MEKIKLVIAIPDSYKYKSLDDMILAYGKKKKILRIFIRNILQTLQSLSKNVNHTKNSMVQKTLKLLLPGYAWELTKNVSDSSIFWRNRSQATRRR